MTSRYYLLQFVLRNVCRSMVVYRSFFRTSGYFDASEPNSSWLDELPDLPHVSCGLPITPPTQNRGIFLVASVSDSFHLSTSMQRYSEWKMHTRLTTRCVLYPHDCVSYVHLSHIIENMRELECSLPVETAFSMLSGRGASSITIQQESGGESRLTHRLFCLCHWDG